MSNSAERAAGVEGATSIPSLSLSFELYERSRAALDRALEKATQRALGSGNIEKRKEMLLLLDQMTREHRDL